MKIVLFTCLLIAVFSSPVFNPFYLEKLQEEASFEVYDYESHPFKDFNKEQILGLLGLKGLSSEPKEKLPFGITNEDLPESFVASEKWPECIHEIRNQQSCGSCWAFAASEVLSDRFCIASDSKTNVVLSPQDMVSCDTQDLGCNGGYLDRSWEYLVHSGIVSDECYPYTSGGGDTGRCKLSGDKCPSGKGVATKYHAKNYYEYNTVEEIKKDLFTNGPIETGFTVYSDFMSYKGGIYKQTSYSVLGGHAVKVIGWGVENGTNYWIVANSWGPAWGEKGFFRIEIGNCCNFENGMISGLPKLTSDAFLNWN